MDSNPTTKEKVMSYEEKSVGSTPFFKCEACPYMALAVDDIKFHLFTVHPELAKKNGLAENIQINCPGCSSIFEAEETLRTHLRNHHKMGFKDVKKMVKSLIQIALKNVKLKKDVPLTCRLTTKDSTGKIPQVIEIVPDASSTINEQLPRGVAFISMDELHKMSTPNFEKVDPKDVIQEASINIVYTEEVSTQYVNMPKASTAGPCNLVQMSNVPPDLISSIQPQKNNSIITSKDDILHPDTTKPYKYKPKDTDVNPKELGTLCSVNKCHIRLKEPKIMAYHRKCHHNGQLRCPECLIVFATAEPLHSHLWKSHSIDLELPTCDICGYKTFKRYRLINIHMKCHKKIRAYPCTVCSKAFKNANQLYKHRIIHKKTMQCHICKTEFSNQQRLQLHISAVHDKIKPFKCSHCDYSCARKEELKLHIRSHTGDKPYACDQCSYRSGDHNAMRRHKLGHSNESLYKCKYCPYSTIQSTMFAFHMLSSHPDVDSGEVHCCPYCPFKTVNKDKYAVHLSTHTHGSEIENEVVQRDMKKDKSKSWTIPSEHTKTTADENRNTGNENQDAVNSIPIEVYDCDSLPDNMPSDETASNFSDRDMVTDFSKEDNNSDCVISDGLNIIERHQFASQNPIKLPYESTQTNLHYLGSSLSMDPSLRPSVNVDALAPNHSSISSGITNNIMANLPIRLPPVPISLRNNITLKPVGKISLPMPKVTGPIITPTQILPVPSSSHSPINVLNDNEGLPRKKAKISVKSNLILKGPDQVNMFHSQQKMAFKQLENNERYGLGSPVTFNNLITTQFMQLPPEPVLSESPANILNYSQENLLGDATTPSVGNELTNDPQIFSFNQQMNVNSLTMLPPVQKIQTNDPSYIKLEGTIKQNTQSPSLERMCTANLLNGQALSIEYKASPPLEDIHKNISEIKNEVKSDAFYNIPLNNSAPNPPIDQYLMDNLLSEQYSSHLDLTTAVMPDLPDQSDVIEIDDNSDDNKLLSRFDVNYALESLFLMHNDFHFLENDGNTSEIVTEVNRMVPEVSATNQKDADETQNDLELLNCVQGKRDPMMNTSVRPSTNKINVKNIELMKN
ncbi:unnamed protein product [Pieris brassicae]|uniref:C2H2-type domain-containing protein n=2 Tax=Pieris brassicae TaxID=7116 RepID=A0A9P0X1R3_PIEBR|nr:unnamed protein product [Pieris brassicae]